MAKKKKKKHIQKAIRKYNKKQFVEIICKQCKLCTNPDASFCHKEMYRKKPREFMDSCYLNLLRISGEHEKDGTRGPMSMDDFEQVFCESSVCHETGYFACAQLYNCYEEYKGQDHVKKKGRKKKESYVFEAYATFFCSDDEEWQKTIKEILGDEG